MVCPFCLLPGSPTLDPPIPECVALWGQKMKTEWLTFSILIPKRKLNKETHSLMTPVTATNALEAWRPGHQMFMHLAPILSEEDKFKLRNEQNNP